MSYIIYGDAIPAGMEGTPLTGKDSNLIYPSAAKMLGPGYFSHAAYDSKKCGSCHNIDEGNALHKMPPQLCYSCHENMNNKYKTLHGPVASGYCLDCHDPHLAKYKKLLSRTGRQLCLDCHNENAVFQNKIHERVRQTVCTECHNAHGGDNSGMLSASGCRNCHDDFSVKYQYLHGPVAGGYCNHCHGSHLARANKLLVKENNSLCLDCHNREFTMKNKVHADIQKAHCTDCHNPHGGTNRYFVN